MHWTLLNGSPRGRESNTTLLLTRLATGLEASGATTELLHLAHPADRDRAPARYAAAGRFVLGFPLYTDSMPGQVKAFMEALQPLQGRVGNPPMAFLVQSGFPEPGQSRAVEQVLERFAERMGSRCLGTIVKGGVEGIRLQPPWMARGLLGRVESIGRALGATDRLDPETLRDLAGPDWFTGWRRPLLSLATAAWANPFWSLTLRKHGAHARRFDRPHERL